VYDYRSPYAYLADTQLPTLGARIVYKPSRVMEVICPPLMM
jgi:2-hydroxychromene-2-carboxylate isomerase